MYFSFYILQGLLRKTPLRLKVYLILTGTNVTQNSPKYFSVYHTPDLSVVHAVAISMNIPFAFKPVYIGRNVKKSENATYNNNYKGLYVDGGVLNNFPIHAINSLCEKKIIINEKELIFKVANTDIKSKINFNIRTLGFRFIEYLSPKYELKDVYGDGQKVDGNNIAIFYRYSLDIYSKIRFDSTEGQILNNVKNNEIKLESTGISLLDFASP